MQDHYLQWPRLCGWRAGKPGGETCPASRLRRAGMPLLLLLASSGQAGRDRQGRGRCTPGRAAERAMPARRLPLPILGALRQETPGRLWTGRHGRWRERPDSVVASQGSASQLCCLLCLKMAGWLWEGRGGRRRQAGAGASDRGRTETCCCNTCCQAACVILPTSYAKAQAGMKTQELDRLLPQATC